MKTAFIFLLLVSVITITIYKVCGQHNETLEDKVTSGLLQTFSNESSQSSERFLIPTGGNKWIEYKESGKVYAITADDRQFDITAIQQMHRLNSLKNLLRK